MSGEEEETQMSKAHIKTEDIILKELMLKDEWNIFEFFSGISSQL